MRETTTTTTTKTAKNVAPKSATKKVTAAPKNDSVTNVDVTRASTAERRHMMISEAAYYIAEKAGFNPDHSADYWLEAERQIDSKLLAH